MNFRYSRSLTRCCCHSERDKEYRKRNTLEGLSNITISSAICHQLGNVIASVLTVLGKKLYVVLIIRKGIEGAK